MKKILIVGYIMLLTACSTTNIIDYDPEKETFEHMKNVKKAQQDAFYAEETPPHVDLFKKDGINIVIDKKDPLVGRMGIRLDRWEASAINHNNLPKCVAVDWRLLDFEYESQYPDEFLVYGNSVLNFAHFRQTIWAFDKDTFLVLPPSGYVNDISVRDADINEKGHYECMLNEDWITDVGDDGPEDWFTW